jgi:hypothetical protein
LVRKYADKRVCILSVDFEVLCAGYRGGDQLHNLRDLRSKTPDWGLRTPGKPASVCSTLYWFHQNVKVYVPQSKRQQYKEKSEIHHALPSRSATHYAIVGH